MAPCGLARLGRGASRLKDGAFTTYTTKEGLASNTVAAVLETADGAIWFATPNGASVKSPDGWRRYSTADGLPSNDVNTLFEDSARNVWVGTAAGLAVMHEGRMQSLPGVPALLRASILGLAEDRAGGLWIAATGHVLRVDREKLLARHARCRRRAGVQRGGRFARHRGDQATPHPDGRFAWTRLALDRRRAGRWPTRVVWPPASRPHSCRWKTCRPMARPARADARR